MRAPSAPALVPAATHRGGAATRPGPALSAAVLVLPGAVLLSAPQAGRAAVVPPGWAPLLEPAGVAAPPVPVPPARRRPVPAAAQATPQRAELHEDGKSPPLPAPPGAVSSEPSRSGKQQSFARGKIAWCSHLSRSWGESRHLLWAGCELPSSRSLPLHPRGLSQHGFSSPRKASQLFF